MTRLAAFLSGLLVGISAFYGWLYVSSLALRVSRIEAFLSHASRR